MASAATTKGGDLAIPGRDAQSVDVSNINLAYDRSSQVCVRMVGVWMCLVSME